MSEKAIIKATGLDFYYGDHQALCDVNLSLFRNRVTALIGLAELPQMARIRGCAYCTMQQTCTLRKGGKHCGI